MNYKEFSNFLLENDSLIHFITIWNDYNKLDRESIAILLELIDNNLISYENYKDTNKLMYNIYYDIKYDYNFYYNELYINNSLNKIIDRLEKIELRLNKE